MNFKDLQFASPIVRAIAQCGYTVPTEIQQQAIPSLLKGKDLLGLAQTGTGKTAAYLLPVIQTLLAGKSQPGKKGARALILVPTRELAEQVHSNTLQLTKFTPLRSCTVYGGVSKTGQIKNITRGVDIIIACPGRLLDHINSKILDLKTLEIFILDEADQMCDIGFLPDIRRILKYVPEKRQSIVFSATMPDEVRGFVENMLVNPVTIQIDHDKPTAQISHTLFQVVQEKKTTLLRDLLHSGDIRTALVFTRTRYKAKSLAMDLSRQGFPATSIQGNLSQSQRKSAMDGFRSGRFKIMVATDIAARGIDISGISHVINYDVPDTVEAFTHRVGRTGRAQESGQALTFATPGDKKFIRQVESHLGKIFSSETSDWAALMETVMSMQPVKGKNPVKAKKNKGAVPQKGKVKHARKRSAQFDFSSAPKQRSKKSKKIHTAL